MDDSDAFLQELEGLSCVGAQPEQVANDQAAKRDESPQGMNVPGMSATSEIDFGDIGQDFLDASGGNSTVSRPLLLVDG